MPDTVERPHVDPKSVSGHIAVSAAYIVALRLNRQCAAALNAECAATSTDYETYWFRDTPTTRRILGMEKK